MRGRRRSPPFDVRGFSLIELLCALAVVCLLAAIAYPTYQAVVMRSRRFDAQTALLQLQGSEERYRVVNAQYGLLADLHAAAASPSGFYALAVTSASAVSYELLASAVGSQQSDASCRHMKLAVSGELVSYASGADASTSNSVTDNKRCWGI